jgi:transcription elongation factor GreB
VSRAFTKEDDAGDDLPERPVPEGPNYVTPRGLELLRQAVRELVAARANAADPKPVDRDLRYLEARIDSAIVVPPGSGPEARFGAAVTLKDEAGAIETFRIVGEDEARGDAALMPWSAPLAQAVLGARAGDAVTWEGPEGVARYTVVAVAY